MTIPKKQTQGCVRCIFRITKTITVKRAKRTGDTRKLLLVGLAVLRQGSMLRLILVKRKLEQIRIN